MPAPRAAVGRAQAGFLTFPSGQRSLCVLAAEGTQPAPRRFVPTCLHHTHPPGPAALGSGEGLCQGPAGVWDENPPPKKCRQKIHYPPAWGCVSARPRAGTGTGFEQVLHSGVPWGVWGALMGWEQVGSLLPKLEPRSSSCCAPPSCTFILFMYSPPSPRSA